MAEGETSVAAREPGISAQARDPDALADQIERTRAELARTIDSIADRVNPAHVARRALHRARARAAAVDPKVAAAAAVLVVGVAAYLVWRRRRR